MEYTTNLLLRKPEYTDPSDIADINYNMDLIDASIVLNEFDKANDPTINDDSGNGYSKGSIWLNTYANKVFQCLDNTAGAAIWAQIYPITDIEDAIHAADSKTTPHDDDEFGIVDTEASNILKKLTITNLKAKLKTYFDTLYAVAAKGVTNGDSHDHSGGDGAQIDHGGLGGLSDDDHTQYIKHALSTAQYDFLVGKGDDTFEKKTLAETKVILGASDGWTSETNFTATPASTSTLTMTADRTSIILVGSPIRYTISSVVYYGVVTALTSNLMTIAGAPLSGDVTALHFSDSSKLAIIEQTIFGTFADAANTALISSDGRSACKWQASKAYLVKISHKVRVDDTGANQPQVTASVAGSVVGTDNTNVGLPVAETWTDTVVGINVSNYDINPGEAIEILTDANGSNDDALDLVVSLVFVFP